VPDGGAPDAGTGDAGSSAPDAGTDDAGSSAPDSGLQAVLFVATDEGQLRAYQEGTWVTVGLWSGLPWTDGVRGMDADPTAGDLYVAHGGDNTGSTGGLLAWSVTQHATQYSATYAHGVDQLALCGGRIYLPAGELASNSTWYILNQADGSALGSEQGGQNPHNTVCVNGVRYEGGRLDTSLVVHGLGPGRVGPSPSSVLGVRPFTVNAAGTRAFITWTSYRGFSVGDVTTGQILSSTNFGPVPAGFPATAPSHGISLSPDGSELYVLDTPADPAYSSAFTTNQQVRVYSGSDIPQLQGVVSLPHPLLGNESPCAYDCLRDGWLLHSRDGKYVYVGDSGDVIDTRTRTAVAFLPALQNSRHGFVEVDFALGVPVDTTTHFGVGH
jgi:hypothetical protein